jgi:hypothetical protein
MRLKSYALIATLVTAALAAPAAQAMPIQDPQTSPRVAEARTATGQLPGPPASPADPQPIKAVETAPADGFPWETVLFAVVGAGLALAAWRLLGGARRRPHATA